MGKVCLPRLISDENRFMVLKFLEGSIILFKKVRARHACDNGGNIHRKVSFMWDGLLEVQIGFDVFLSCSRTE